MACLSMMQAQGGLMMWGMVLFWILVLVVLTLGAAALVKYLVAPRREAERG